MNGHTYQRQICAEAQEVGLTPILNAACKEDPACLGRDYGALNFDIADFDPATSTVLKEIPNFMQGSVLELSTLFDEGHFGCAVMGEFIEHCVFHAAKQALLEVRKVLRPDGWLVLTFPLDNRPPSKQHSPDLLKIIPVKGETGHDITFFHQTVWEDDMLERLFRETGWRVRYKTQIDYGFLSRPKPHGWGIVLVKTDSRE